MFLSAVLITDSLITIPTNSSEKMIKEVKERLCIRGNLGIET